jgi:hypothetical protein
MSSVAEPSVPNSLDTALLRSRLAELHLARGEWTQAVNEWTQSSELLVELSKRDAAALAKAPSGPSVPATKRYAQVFFGLIKASRGLAQQVPADDDKLLSATFVTAQWAQQSEAASSLAQMAARQPKGDTPLSLAVRERQDLLAEWQGIDKLLVTARGAPQANRDIHSTALVEGV